MKPLAIFACVSLLATPALAQQAEATFINAAGEQVGDVTLVQTPEGVVIEGTVTGLTAGPHGFHVHETGNCDPSTKFESAGGHFEPGEHKHGLENPDGPHAGDISNQTGGDDGIAIIGATNAGVSLIDGEAGYLFDDDGSALVIHEGPDDNKTDPSGNSGGRAACAVIEATSP